MDKITLYLHEIHQKVIDFKSMLKHILDYRNMVGRICFSFVADTLIFLMKRFSHLQAKILDTGYTM